MDNSDSIPTCQKLYKRIWDNKEDEFWDNFDMKQTGEQDG